MVVCVCVCVNAKSADNNKKQSSEWTLFFGYYLQIWHSHTHNHFTALLTLSRTTRLRQYQKVHFAIFWIFWCKIKITQADTTAIWMDCHPILTGSVHHTEPRKPNYVQIDHTTVLHLHHVLRWLSQIASVHFTRGFKVIPPWDWKIFFYVLCHIFL